MHITCTNFTDSGNYSCHFFGSVNENAKQEIVEEKFLNIYVKGEITPSKDVRIQVGNEAQLSCTITGYPYVNYQWHKINGASKEDLLEVDQYVILINKLLIELFNRNKYYSFIKIIPNHFYEWEKNDYTDPLTSHN